MQHSKCTGKKSCVNATLNAQLQVTRNVRIQHSQSTSKESCTNATFFISNIFSSSSNRKAFIFSLEIGQDLISIGFVITILVYYSTPCNTVEIFC